jgi:hypothetical protein
LLRNVSKRPLTLAVYEDFGREARKKEREIESVRVGLGVGEGIILKWILHK